MLELVTYMGHSQPEYSNQKASPQPRNKAPYNSH